MARKIKRPPDIPAFPIYLRQWRTARGVTQAEIAAALGVNKSSISRIERGQRQYSRCTLEGYAVELECQPGDLISREPPTNVRPRQRNVLQKMLRDLDQDDLIEMLNRAVLSKRRRRVNDRADDTGQ
jgi:transcriptional regulator with XRE-family HTH domain